MTTKIPLSQGLFAIVDDADAALVNHYIWRVSFIGPNVYAYAWDTYPKYIAMHRLILHAKKGEITDHKNGDGLDNRRSNLRIVTYSENAHNRRGVKGYHFENARNKWKAMISVDGKAIFLGRFDREEDAAQAYWDAKRAYLPRLFDDEQTD